MLCPLCPRKLDRKPRGGVETWHCRDCAGCAVLVAELEKLTSPAQIEQLLSRARSPGAAWGKRCPNCMQVMREARVRDVERLFILDWCETCDVMWFDVPEFSSVLPVEEADVEEADVEQETADSEPARPAKRKDGRPADPSKEAPPADPHSPPAPAVAAPQTRRSRRKKSRAGRAKARSRARRAAAERARKARRRRSGRVSRDPVFALLHQLLG